MDDVFTILSNETITLLESQLNILFASQVSINTASDIHATDSSNSVFGGDLVTAEVVGASAYPTWKRSLSLSHTLLH